MEILLAALLTVGVSYLLLGVFDWVEKGLRYAVPWWIAWFILHWIALGIVWEIGGCLNEDVLLLCYLVEFGCVYIKRDGRLNELLGNFLGVSPCCRLHGAYFCERLG